MQVATVQTNANRANMRVLILMLYIQTHVGDVIRGGADAFSNTFERRDIYELGQVGYREE